MSHANARLTPAGRLIMVQRIGSGRAVAHVAAEMGISSTTAWRWWRRFREHGTAGLVDRSSVAHGHPRRTGACVEARVRIMRHLTRRGPVFIADKLGPQHGSVAAGVGALFDFVSGATFGEPHADKTVIISRAVNGLGVDNLADAVMVGDRSFDIDGAHGVGLKCIGVLEGGYGDENEFKTAGADWIVDTLADVKDIILK